MRIENDDLLTKLNQRYRSLSKGQKQLATYILGNYDKAAFITASQMGRMVGVSESTVVRFAYALGYDGYPELQKSLQELIRNKLTSVQRIQLSSAEMDQANILKSVLKADMQNIRSTIETIDNVAFNAAIDVLLEAENVYIIGFRSASPLAQFLAYYLNFVRGNIILVNAFIGDAYEQMIRIGPKDVCVGISFPRYSTRTLDAMSFAKNHSASIIALTDGHASPLAQMADFALIARSDMASFADSLVAPLSLINAVLVAAGLRCKDEISDRFDQLESIWGMQRVYLTRRPEDE
ncbi:MAG: MurR/RpiR family transcriptional regulator [Bacillota bacterium]